MSARPGNWSLVGYGSDPLPGDVHDVDAQARSYRDVAAEIDAQIARLKQIAGGDDGAKGQYVDPLRESATELSGELSKVQNRFDTVASRLTTWASTLDEGRARSQAILHSAEEAHDRVVSSAPGAPLPQHATQAEIDADTARAKRHSAATADLNSAVEAMRDLMDGTRNPPGINGIARSIARAINDAANDSVKDSWWDSHVRKWVHEHAHLIEVIIKIIAVVAIVVAVVALVLATGGFGLLALAGVGAEALATMGAVASVLEMVGAGLSGAVLLGDATLKAGGEKVSWTQLGLDALSCVTFGGAAVLGRMAKPLVAGAEDGAKLAAKGGAIERLPQYVKSALHMSTDNPLFQWASRTKAAAVDDAVSTVETALKKSPDLVRTAALGRKTASELQSLRYLTQYPEVAEVAKRALLYTRLEAGLDAVDHLKLGGVELPKFPHEFMELPKDVHVILHKAEWYGAGGE